ncbi:SMI1/KNR4 family protein [Chondromyces crocatus]|uniref:Knr4/Smi1-like domain-containing protein n=1 Tax=Chondromyces crocatus TaxID=52 RepID=A0A0K1EBM9_CHOCO|nr:SMI1/KNR4 family protein [Chondromyces crocatus]AKT37988.1 uncharacterized protein CMC5_021290 [Chondromyces crocatus]
MTPPTSQQASQLIDAVTDGETSTVTKLLKAGADPDTRTEDGEPVLSVACSEGDLATVSALLDAGAEVDALDGLDEPPLASAAAEGHVDLIARLVAAGADVHLRFGEDEHTHLTRALDVNLVMEPSLQVIEALLAAGVDPNTPSGNGWSPLHYAASFEEPGLVDIIDALVARGADPKRPSPRGIYAIDLAERHAPDEVKARLLAHGSPTLDEAALLRVQAFWARIRQWLTKHAPTYEARIARAASASPQDIEALEARLGASLPPDFRAHLLLFGKGGATSADRAWFYEYTGLSIAEIIDRWEGLEELRQKGTFADATPHELDRDDDKVKWTWWHRGWIPFAEDGGGNLFCVDVDPEPEGSRGQIICWEMHSGPVGPRADDFDTFLDEYHEEMMQGRLEYTGETLCRK